MRFLLGLMFGAAAVLLIAAGAAGEGDWRARADAALRDLQVHASDVWRRMNAEVAARDAAANGGSSRSGDRSHSAGPAAAPATRPAPPRATDPPAPPLTLAAAEADPPAAAPPPEPAAAALPEPAAEPIPRPPDPEPVDRLQALSGVQRVWVPFRSELSASGFAARLSESLEHPFRVERQGPGRYQVVFPYGSEPERRALLAQAVDATGLPL